MNPIVSGRLFLPVLVGGLLVLAGCSEDATKPEPPGPEPHARSTLAGTIEYFAQAHENRDLEAYGECLVSDYTFWFPEDDYAHPTWGWSLAIDLTEDLDVMDGMFAAECVMDIRMTLTNYVAIPDSLDFYVAEEVIGVDTVTVFWALFGVDLHVVEETQDQEIDHWVDGRANIYLREDPNANDLWTIWKIEDLGNDHKSMAATESTTWSGVKEMYRK
ncbi:MAG: hypothetical protein KAW17_12050 [Candidatus Eisenbacteria sp.]|nr:hypothetical protein [Candidatus Eisenbacteria bacterium]